jgi:hypothetical protein
VAYVVAILVADRFLQSEFSMRRELSLALGFAAVQMVAITLMVLALFVRKQHNAMRLARSKRMAPLVQEALALHAIGIDQKRRLEELWRQAPDDVRETLFSVLVSMRGEPRDRVVAVAGDLGFVEQRGQKTVEWIRNVIRIGHADRFEQIVALISHEPLLVRAIAAEELSTYAALIPEASIAAALRSPDVAVVVTVLEMLRAWRRALHVGDVVSLLSHESPRVRAAALLALPYAAAGAMPDTLAGPFRRLLDDQDPQVRAAAALVAGRMGIAGVADSLALRLADPDRHTAVAAAFALAALGDRGSVLLNRAVLSSDRTAASVAFEALEKSALGLAELV